MAKIHMKKILLNTHLKLFDAEYVGLPFNISNSESVHKKEGYTSSASGNTLKYSFHLDALPFIFSCMSKIAIAMYSSK